MFTPIKPAPDLPPKGANPNARKQRLLIIVIIALVACAALILLLPGKLPYYAKLAMAAVDLVTAVAVGLVLRQMKK